MCALIRSFLSTNISVLSGGREAQAGYNLVLTNCNNTFGVVRNEFAKDKVGNRAIAVVQGAPLKPSYLGRVLKMAVLAGVILPHLTTTKYASRLTAAISNHDSLGRMVNQYQADFQLLRSWIDECVGSGNHIACTPVRPALRIFTRVIDCYTREVVPLTDGMAYLALSYVWGTSAAQKGNETVDFVPRPAPATIEDAMHVVRNLGERYLWADQYCVRDDENKSLQIRNMHLIYEGAMASIIAVSGSNQDSGLPGVSLPRIAQCQVRKDGLTVVSTLRHISLLLSNSIWGTRGWTFQEMIISRRCLFFTDEQVHFACKTSARRESFCEIECAPEYGFAQRLGPNLLSMDRPFDDTSHDKAYIFETYVREYTRRVLSYDSDGLNAFRGLLAAQEFHTYWGIPFSLVLPSSETDMQLYFCLGLAWRTTTHAEPIRRTDFPSWCWASIKGEVQLDSSKYDALDAELIEHASIQIENANGDLIPIDTHFESHRSSGKLLPEPTPYLWVTGNVMKVRLRSARESDRGVYEAITEGVLRWTSGEETFEGTVNLDVCESKKLKRRLLSESWDVLLLAQFTNRKRSFPTVYMYGLLLDWEGQTASRIGRFKEGFAHAELHVDMAPKALRLG